MITYLKGDATNPQGEGKKVIAHICNDLGAWGHGFVVPLGNKYPTAKTTYLASKPHLLSHVHSVQVAEDIYVMNMIAQKGIGGKYDKIDKKALESCLVYVASFTEAWGATLHMPRIGCGLGGSSWDKIEPIIQKTCNQACDVFVYDLEK